MYGFNIDSVGMYVEAVPGKDMDVRLTFWRSESKDRIDFSLWLSRDEAEMIANNLLLAVDESFRKAQAENGKLG